MCGIVGLHLKNAALYPLVLMVVSMSSRGPDSTGSVLHDGDTMGGVKDADRGRPALDTASSTGAGPPGHRPHRGRPPVDRWRTGG